MAATRSHEGQGWSWRRQGLGGGEDLPGQEEAAGADEARLGRAARLGGANSDDDLAQATIIYDLLAII